MVESSFLRWRDRCLSIALALLLLVILALRLAQPINLAAVDIGRHIANGQLVLSGNTDIFYKNYYSFTHLEYPFINHHWLFGVMSALIFQCGGFDALSIFYIVLILGAVLFFLRASFLRGQGAPGLLIAFMVLPLLWDRREIRPEGVSFLMMGIYFYVLTQLSLAKINRVLVLCIFGVLQVIWVNTHIFFFMGPVLIVFFILEGKGRGCSVCVRQLFPLLWLSIAANLINPSGLAGMITPLNIFKGFGYRLAENQNVFFMMSFFPGQKIYGYYLCLVVAGFFIMVAAFIARGQKTNIALMVLLVFTALAGIKAVRLMQGYALFFIPLGAYFFTEAQSRLPHALQSTLRKVILVTACVMALAHLITVKPAEAKIGLYPGVNASADFYKINQLQGPIFSNYDIGGYLIYHLHAQEKVFVDNRQEAFPGTFFKDVYMKMQQDEEMWHAMDKRYDFNVIYFYRHDLTEWGQSFLINRVQDLRWAPVFVDNFTIIFAKRNQKNQELILRSELPRAMFGISRK